MELKLSGNKDKRYTATFKDGKKINFGSKGANTFIDKASEKTKDAYLARHKVNEDWSNPKTAGSLSRYILWGPTKSVSQNLKLFKKKFNV